MEKDKYREQAARFASYLLVGGGATLVEWACYLLLSAVLGLHYLLSTVLAITISTFSNWTLGRLITFRRAARQNIPKEICKVYAVSLTGLLANVLLMWLLHGILGVWDFLAKVLATAIVLVYNYSVRVLVIYRK